MLLCSCDSSMACAVCHLHNSVETQNASLRDCIEHEWKLVTVRKKSMKWGFKGRRGDYIKDGSGLR